MNFYNQVRSQYPKELISPNGEWIVRTVYVQGWGGYNLEHSWFAVAHPEVKYEASEFTFVCNLADGELVGYEIAFWREGQPCTLVFSSDDNMEVDTYDKYPRLSVDLTKDTHPARDEDEAENDEQEVDTETNTS